MKLINNLWHNSILSILGRYSYIGYVFDYNYNHKGLKCVPYSVFKKLPLWQIRYYLLVYLKDLKQAKGLDYPVSNTRICFVFVYVFIKNFFN